MTSVGIAWLIGGACGAIFLLQMMRQRHRHLVDLLRAYGDQQRNIAKLRAQATKLARSAAQQRALNEIEASALEEADALAGAVGGPQPDISESLATAQIAARQ